MFKTIASNTAAQLVAKFVGAGLTFITTALIIRLSGPSVFGDLTKSLVLIAIGFTVIDFGLNAVVVRQIGRGSDVGRGFADLLFTRLLLSALLVIALNILVYQMPSSYSDQIKSVFWVGSLAIIFQGIYTSCNAIFQSQENYWRSTTSTIFGTVIGAGLTYYFILTSPTLFHFLLAGTIGYLAMALCSLYFLVPLLPKLYSLKFKSLTSLFRSAIPLGAILLSSVAASKFDTVILGFYRASSEVGQYGFAYRIFDVLLVLPSFLMNAAYPSLVSKKGNSFKFIRQISFFMLFSGMILTIITWYLAPHIYLIRPELNLSITSLRLLSLSLPLFFLTAPLMWFEISRNREDRVFYIYFAAALINIILNLMFIPSSGVFAAAINTGVTELFILLSLLHFSRR